MPVEMKKLILLTFLALAIYGGHAAINQDSITLSLRKKAYDRYHKVKDTVTVRTWMNMDRMNKALIQVLEYDNQLLESYENKDTAIVISDQLSNDSSVQKPLVISKTMVEPAWFQIKYLLAASILVGVILVVLIVLFVQRTIRIKKLRQVYNEREETFDSKLNRLEYLENEVLKMKTRENEIKAELEKGIVDYQDKMQTLRKRIEELAVENTRLENLNIALSDGKVDAGDASIEKTEEIKQEIIAEIEGVLKRVKKTRK
jgi:hypothetical protein